MIGIVCGLRSEAQALARAFEGLPGFSPAAAPIAIAGASATRAEVQAAELYAKGARACFSVGLAGALDPMARSGECVTARMIALADGVRLPADAGLVALLVQSVAAPRNYERAFGADRPIGGVADKAALRGLDCGFVDMESHGVARAAAAAGRPWAPLRAIADDASTPLPDWTLKSVRPDGSLAVADAVIGLIRRPADFPVALRLAKANQAALTALARRIAPVLAELAGGHR